MSRTLQAAVFVLILVCGPAVGAATAYKCPERIAAGNNNLVSIRTVGVLKQIYQALDCPTEFVFLPLNRGVQNFNSGKVDGESLRITQAERLYKVPFVRSATPMYTLVNGVWSHPDKRIQSRRPLGYVHGIIWQAAYVKGHSTLKFYSEDDMFRAYSKGLLGSFLSSDFTVEAKAQAGGLAPLPVRTNVVKSLEVFHYVHKAFSDFMAAFSSYIEKNKPFKKSMLSPSDTSADNLN